MRTAQDTVVLIDRLPYPAWRILMDHLWIDDYFRYYVTPKFRNDGSITVLLLGTGGPTRYKTLTPHQEASTTRKEVPNRQKEIATSLEKREQQTKEECAKVYKSF